MRDMSFAAPLLALSQDDSPMLLWLIVGALIALGPSIRAWIEVVKYFKGSSTDTSNFVTRAEILIMKQERDAYIATTIGDLKSNFNKLEDLLTDLTRDLPSLHRALGKLEGHDEAEFKRRAR